MDIDISAKRIVVEEEVKEKAKQLATRLAEEFPNQKITSVVWCFPASLETGVRVDVKTQECSLLVVCPQIDTSCVFVLDEGFAVTCELDFAVAYKICTVNNGQGFPDIVVSYQDT